MSNVLWVARCFWHWHSCGHVILSEYWWSFYQDIYIVLRVQTRKRVELLCVQAVIMDAQSLVMDLQLYSISWITNECLWTQNAPFLPSAKASVMYIIYINIALFSIWVSMTWLVSICRLVEGRTQHILLMHTQLDNTQFDGTWLEHLENIIIATTINIKSYLV